MLIKMKIAYSYWVMTFFSQLINLLSESYWTFVWSTDIALQSYCSCIWDTLPYFHGTLFAIRDVPEDHNPLRERDIRFNQK